jgi:hypothetical protein
MQKPIGICSFHYRFNGVNPPMKNNLEAYNKFKDIFDPGKLTREPTHSRNIPAADRWLK